MFFNFRQREKDLVKGKKKKKKTQKVELYKNRDREYCNFSELLCY